jgi:anti-sigma factor RsiW
MKCAEVGRRVERFVDGVLDKRLAEEIEAHLRSCPQCSAQVGTARALLTGSAAPAARASAGFAVRVMEAVYREALAQGPRTSAPERQEVLPTRQLVPVYRRLGLSLVLTAGVLAASLFVPRVSYQGLLGSGSSATEPSRERDAGVPRGLGAAVQSALSEADSVVRGIQREQAHGGSER